MPKIDAILKGTFRSVQRASAPALLAAAAAVLVFGSARSQVTVDHATGRHANAHGGIAPHSPSPRAFVANTSSNSLSVIDLDTNTVTATIPVGPSPTRVAVSPDGTRALVTNFYGASVTVVDLGTSSVVATIPVGTYPAGVAISPTGTQACVVRDYNGLAVLLDMTTNTVVATIPVGAGVLAGTGAVAFTPDGADAYVATGLVSVIDAATHSVINGISTGAAPVCVTMTNDGSRAYVVNEFSGSIASIDTETQTVSSTINVGDLPFSFAVTPDGSRGYVTIAAHLQTNGTTTNVIPDLRVKALDLNTGGLLATIVLSQTPDSLAMHPDGSRVYVTTPSGNSVRVIDTAINAEIAVIPVGTTPRGIAIR